MFWKEIKRGRIKSLLECPAMGLFKQLVWCLLFMVWLVHSGEAAREEADLFCLVLYLLLALLLQLFFSVCHSVGWSLILFTLCFSDDSLCSLSFLVFGALCLQWSYLYSHSSCFKFLTYLFNFSFHPKKGY